MRRIAPVMNALIASLLLIQAQPETLRLTVAGADRTALLYNASTPRQSAPIVFVFHGFGGNARQAARSYRVHEEWPEALVVYPQGLVLHSPILNREGPGWQHKPGDLDDRDLRFFDALVEKIAKDFKGDPNRVYVCGMSNGALFSYELYATRSEKIAASAPVAGAGGLWLTGVKQPRPILIIAGESDPLVSFRSAELTRNACVRIANATKQDKEWAPGYVLYRGKNDDATVIWRQHPGGHVWPSDATKQIVRFFREVDSRRKATSPRRSLETLAR
jgi:polyhydroxybutyrate depolymerase